MNRKTDFDVVGIGDIVIDAFIRLNIGHLEETAHGVEYCIPYGTKTPYEFVTEVPAVGNTPNAMVAMSRLGLNTALLSFVGNDQHGKECLKRLEEEKISTMLMRTEDGKATNYHYVLWYKDDRTILIKHENFTVSLGDIGKPKWVYLSSIAETAMNIHFELLDYLTKNPDVKLAFQPGTFQLKKKDELMEIYKRCDCVCMNKEEAEQFLATEERDIKVLLDGLMKINGKIVIITDGPNGSYIKYDNTYLFMPLFPDIGPAYDRTGAGDAFFSTFIAYLAKGYDEAEAFKRAPINSMNVVQHVGAQEGLLTEDVLEKYLKEAPDSYKLKIVE